MTMTNVQAFDLYRKVRDAGPAAITLLSSNPSELTHTALEALVLLGDALSARDQRVQELLRSNGELMAAVERYLELQPPEINGQWEVRLNTSFGALEGNESLAAAEIAQEVREVMGLEGPESA